MTTPADPPAAAASSLPAHVDVMDGLRGLAIAWVVWFHVWQLSWLPQQVGGVYLNPFAETGFTGVELFFFVSGFCLLLPYVRAHLAGRALPTLRHYAYRRAIKILPSYWLSIVAMVAIARPDWLKEPATAAWHLLCHALFVQNLVKSTETAINGVTWSLAVEVQFYLLFPAIAFAFLRLPRLTCVAMVVVAEAWRRGVAAWQPAHLHDLMQQVPAYLDLFAAGMAAAWLIAHRDARPAPGLPARALATLVALGALAAVHAYVEGLFHVRGAMPGWPAPYQLDHRSGLALAFLVLAVASARALPAWQRLLAVRPLVWLSVISYNLYLWHQFLARQLFFTWKWPVPATADPHQDPAWQLQFTLAAYALALGVSWAITHGFERPVLKGGVGVLVAPLRRLGLLGGRTGAAS